MLCGDHPLTGDGSECVEGSFMAEGCNDTHTGKGMGGRHTHTYNRMDDRDE